MRRYSRNDVRFHSDGFRPARPAVCVKTRRFVPAEVVMERFGCSRQLAEQALEYAFNASCREFWDWAKFLAHWALGGYYDIKLWQEGRSGGWAVVEGLPPLECWDAVQLAKWRKFAVACEKAVRARCTDTEGILEDIEANRWAEEGAQEYNFFDRADGSVGCMVELHQAKVAAAAMYSRGVL